MGTNNLVKLAQAMMVFHDMFMQKLLGNRLDLFFCTSQGTHVELASCPAPHLRMHWSLHLYSVMAVTAISWFLSRLVGPLLQ